MAKPYRIPDFRKMYPEASEEVIAVLRTTERKMQYQEYDLKSEQTIIDQENQTAHYPKPGGFLRTLGRAVSAVS